MKIHQYIFILLLAGIFTTASAQPVIVQSIQVSNEISSRNLDNPNWLHAPVATIPLLPQNITQPMLQKSSVNSLSVKSIYNNTHIGFMLQWKDSSRDAIVDADKFCDQVGIQFPMNPDTVPNFMMGNKKGRVHILHWKAIWQDDCEKGFRDVIDAYPNYWTDIYPLLERYGDGSKAAFARDVSASQLVISDAKNYMHGAYAGNPMSMIIRKEPCEETSAEGYGTLATQEMQEASAWGYWADNQWTVLFVRPINSADKNDAPIRDKTKMAFAVWDGNAENIGAKKSYSVWYTLELKK
ncbi:MAG: hypothetical protein DWQ44_05255 [Bacteroidetes bacterium]|nr:MAG: hypothetical protein DWQ33_11900 [Bacteroidota bacterium]REK00782.1 MAG: hypothetical protein DWQ39_11575 [Bacteroidota bacterium]REK35030.1 MAG: hypothetical protein DWQ44_05255 [Bacteroidota bacterium]REK48171.1 MAG: hypothetical protein DWQ48_10090 [Bacteroidota bacterium]